MNELPIDVPEAQALLRFFDAYLPELEFDLSRVKLPRERHELVVQDELLRGLRDRLDTMLRARSVAC